MSEPTRAVSRFLSLSALSTHSAEVAKASVNIGSFGEDINVVFATNLLSLHLQMSSGFALFPPSRSFSFFVFFSLSLFLSSPSSFSSSLSMC